MATFDGSTSLDMVCDEFRENECGPCLLGGRTREAIHYCIDCPDYLCDDCKDYHGKLARNHTVVSGSRIPASVSGMPGLGITCGCNKGQPVAFCCNEHQDIICSACKTLHHYKCKTSSIQEKSLGYTSAKLNAVLAEVKSLMVKYERLKQEISGSKKEVNKLKEDCSKEIKRYRKELDTIFDNLESNILTELDQWKQDKDRHVDQDVSTVAGAFNVLRVDCKRLEDTINDCKKETMFIVDVQVSKTLQTYKRKLEDLENDNEKPTLAFERNELLADLAAGIDTLGLLKFQRKNQRQAVTQQEMLYSTSSTKLLIDRKIKSRSVVNVRKDDDEYNPCITGCTVMPNGHVVLCDQRNKQIKLLDDSWTITGRLQLPTPWDVSVIDSNNVIISLPDTKQLQKVQVLPKMKACSTIQLDSRCWGVAVSAQEIYTTCCYNTRGFFFNPADGEVRVMDLQGNIKRRLGIKPDGSYLFTCPYYITVSASGENIFVSDKDTNTITCLTASGRVIYTYRDGDMSRPRGLICDSGDNVLVCGRRSDNVHTISQYDKKYHTLLTSKNGLSNPLCIAYKESVDTLIVGSNDSNKLLLFKLA